MAASGAALRFPDIRDIIQLNQRLIERYGGDFNGLDNLLNRNSLEWVLDAIQHPFFGEDPYPTITHKAAIIAWVINDGRVFYDGNKRTSMFTAALFLHVNGYQLVATPQEIVSIALAVAQKHETGVTYDHLVQWFKDHVRSFS
jgi:death-on-curing family protein